MIAKAVESEAYSSLITGDVSSKLPFPDDFYDYVIGVGITSYVGKLIKKNTSSQRCQLYQPWFCLLFSDPRRLYDWLRVVKPGGYILLTNRTEVLPQWLPVQEKLVFDRKMSHVFTSEDLFYLPCCPKESLTTRVKVQIYKKSAF